GVYSTAMRPPCGVAASPRAAAWPPSRRPWSSSRARAPRSWRPTAPCPSTAPAIPPSAPAFLSQAEDGIRDWSVTGVQTCALPILGLAKQAGATRAIVVGGPRKRLEVARLFGADVVIDIDAVRDPAERTRLVLAGTLAGLGEIGRASCRERRGDARSGRRGTYMREA